MIQIGWMAAEMVVEMVEGRLVLRSGACDLPSWCRSCDNGVSSLVAWWVPRVSFPAYGSSQRVWWDLAGSMS